MRVDVSRHISYGEFSTLKYDTRAFCLALLIWSLCMIEKRAYFFGVVTRKRIQITAKSNLGQMHPFFRGPICNEAYTVTFGDCAENEKGMQIIGKAVQKGLTVNQLMAIQKKLIAMGMAKVVIACDERIAAKAAGLDQRPLTKREITRHFVRIPILILAWESRADESLNQSYGVLIYWAVPIVGRCQGLPAATPDQATAMRGARPGY